VAPEARGIGGPVMSDLEAESRIINGLEGIINGNFPAKSSRSTPAAARLQRSLASQRRSSACWSASSRRTRTGVSA